MKRAAVFFDRDNTLIESDGYLGDPDKVRLVAGAASAVARAARLGYLVVVVSNQSGVARGMFGEDDVQAVNQRTNELLLERDPAAVITLHEYCPFHPEAPLPEYRKDSDLRKPGAGMLWLAAEKLDLDLSKSWMIGDAPRDIEAGRRAGCRTILFQDATLNTSPAAKEVLTVPPDQFVSTLGQAIDYIEVHGQPPTPPLAEKKSSDQAKPKPATKPAKAERKSSLFAPAEPVPQPAAEPAQAAVQETAERRVASSGPSVAPVGPAAPETVLASARVEAPIEEPAALPIVELPLEHEAGTSIDSGAVVVENEEAHQATGLELVDEPSPVSEAPDAVEPGAIDTVEDVVAILSPPVATAIEPTKSPDPSLGSPVSGSQESMTSDPVSPELVSNVAPDSVAPAARVEPEVVAAAEREIEASVEAAPVEPSRPAPDLNLTTPAEVAAAIVSPAVAASSATTQAAPAGNPSVLASVSLSSPSTSPQTVSPQITTSQQSSTQVPSTHRLELLVEQILRELRRKETRHIDFSLSRLLAGVLQVAALALIAVAVYNWNEKSGNVYSFLIASQVVQTIVVSLLLMDRSAK